jgi:tRNA(fMet)-specific endonuclease VapC
MRYLLDTNIVSDLIRNPQGRCAARIAQLGEAAVCTSIIVAAELRFGAAKRGSARLSAQLESVFGGLEIVPFQAPAEVAYAVLRMQLERDGTPIGGNDMLIAAHAIALGHTMVTDNTREFERIEGLALENWLHDD